jgi:uncharacterized protein YabE (DUF348 family)
MQYSFRLFEKGWQRLLLISAVFIVLSFALVATVRAEVDDTVRDGRLVTFHDRGEEKVIHTYAQSIRDALKDADITLAPKDIIEPSIDAKLVATDYSINIYRARPVIVVDGMVRQKVLTAGQTAKSIVADSDVTKLGDDDIARLTANTNIVTDGASVMLVIDRAVPFTLQMYGKPVATFTHEATVADMLDKKNITLSPSDKLSLDSSTPITAGMTVAIWRDGAQTATVDEEIPFKSRQILDMDQPVGYKAVKTPGVKGSRAVSYEITAQDGKEVKRKVINSVTTKQPTDEVVVVGNAPRNPLSKSRGAQYWTDSRGVSHRETYYDLPMNVVMSACGGGGYTVRADGAKVDKDGYILIAAHLGNYPRCSIVETSMGLGKVYDTGGFTAKHPHGFDLATDWSKPDGI